VLILCCTLVAWLDLADDRYGGQVDPFLGIIGIYPVHWCVVGFCWHQCISRLPSVGLAISSLDKLDHLKIGILVWGFGNLVDEEACTVG